MVATFCLLAALTTPNSDYQERSAQLDALVAQLAKEHGIKVSVDPLISQQSQDVRALPRGFPVWAQSQQGDTARQIVEGSPAQASGFVEAFNNQGAEHAFEHMDPTIQSKVETMAKQLAKNPDFNNPDNLSRMLKLVLSMKYLGIGN